MMEPVTIGPATLYCGDAYAIRPTLGWMDADIMDPPYAFRAEGGGEYRKSRATLERIVEEQLDQGFDRTIINPLLCGSVIVFCHNDQLPQLLPYLDGLFHRFALLSWIKPNPQPMRNKHYLPDTELYVHAWNRGYHPLGEHHDMHRWFSVGRVQSKVFDHPTVKPLPLMTKILTNVQAQTVCDPFMGTGSTGIAAVRAGKRFFGIERNPKHFRTAVERITAAVQQLEKAVP